MKRKRPRGIRKNKTKVELSGNEMNASEEEDAMVNNGDIKYENLEDFSGAASLDEGSNSESTVSTFGIKKLECPECGLSFSTVDNLSIHMLNTHPKTRPRVGEMTTHSQMQDQEI